MTDEMVGGELQDSIAMLEQILEVMPDDPLALKALYNAYHQAENRPLAFTYLTRLADAVVDGDDAETIAYVVEQFSGFEDEYPSESTSWLARFHGAYSESSSSEASAAVRVEERPELDIGEELSLAWRLYEEERLSQEEYSSVLHDLTEMSSKEIDVPVSVLHVLSDRGFVQLNRVMNYISSKSGAPCISLAGFEVAEEIVGLLPGYMIRHEGVMPFAVMGDGLMVGVLNPFNEQLKERAEKVSGRKCYTYLVSPEEYDQVLERIRPMLR